MKRREFASSFLASTSRAIDSRRFARLAVRTASTNSARRVGEKRDEPRRAGGVSSSAAEKSIDEAQNERETG